MISFLMNDKVNKKSLISIIIPTFNHASFLEIALKSVIDQTYTNWEVIVIDNHSLDNTDQVVSMFDDSRLKYLKIHNNGIIAASRNAGIKESNGEWIAFLDSDDWWTVDKLQVCFDSINDKVDFIYHHLEIVGSRTRYLRKKILKTPLLHTPVIIDLLVNGNQIINSSVIVRKKIIQDICGINEDMRIVASEDYDTWLRIAKLTNNFLCIPQNLGYYRVHDGNTSNIAKKDMSLTDRIVINEYLNLLNFYQKMKIEARLKYAKGRFNYFNNNYSDAILNLSFTFFFHNKFSYKLKALITLTMLFMKFIKKSIRKFL